MQELNKEHVRTQNSDSVDRYDVEAHLALRKLKSDDNFNYFEDREAMELYSQLRAQKEEIQILRGQIAAACMRELQLLNEKYILERKVADLRMAIDEKQTEAITSASNELARRKGDLEENLKLAHELKVVDDERYIFMSSMLGLLAEYGMQPHVINASTISNSVKRGPSDKIHFDSDLPHFDAKDGIFRDPSDNGRIISPTLMWAEALDLVLKRISKSGLNFGKVDVVSDSGQEHGSVYWKKRSSVI